MLQTMESATKPAGAMTREELLRRAEALVPKLAARSEACEKARHAFARLAEADALPDFEPLGRPCKRSPAAIVDALNQRRLDRSDRLAPDPDALEPRRDDPRIVHDQRIAGSQEIRQITHMRIC